MPLFYLCCFFLLGAAFSPRLAGSAGAWLAGGLAAILPGGFLLLALRGRRWFSGRRLLPVLKSLHLHPAAVPARIVAALPFLAAAAFCSGAARSLAVQPDLDRPGFIARYRDDGLRYTVIGVIAAPPDVRDRVTYLRIEVEELRPADGVRHLPVSGLVLARVDPGTDWRYGDRVAVTGALRTPPDDEDFSYRDYLARQGIYAYLPFSEAALLDHGQGSPLLGTVYALKARADRVLHDLFPEPEASLQAGILLGRDGGLAPDLQDAFRDTGTSHIIAISGFNIAILSAIFLNLFGRVFGRRLGTGLAVAAIALYTVLVGADAAVLRAAVMGTLAIVLRQAGRTTAGLNSLVVTAALMVFAKPAITGDVGFQLSFAATLGLILYAEPLTRGFARLAGRYLRISVVRRILPFASDAVLLTLAAQFTTLPVILYHFGRLSLSAFLVNPLVLPVQPAVMVLGGLAAVMGMVWLPFGRLPAAAAFPFTAFTIRMVELFSRLPWGVVVTGEMGSGFVLAALFGPMLQRLAGRFDRWRAPLLAVLVIASVWAWRAASAREAGLLRLTLLDVGMGEGILVHTPADRWLLVNGGPSFVRLADQLGRRVPLGERDLDWLVVAGSGDDQVAALPRLLEQYPVHNLLLSDKYNLSQNYKLMQDNMNKRGAPVVAAEAGQVLDLGRGAVLEVLAATPRGAVLLLRWHDLRILLPCGQDFESLSLPVGPVNVLVLAESGYAPLNPPEWIAALQPELVLLSVAAANREGLPAPETLAALAGAPLLRTDRDGWIELASDGEKLWVTTGKGRSP